MSDAQELFWLFVLFGGTLTAVIRHHGQAAKNPPPDWQTDALETLLIFVVTMSILLFGSMLLYLFVQGYNALGDIHF